MSHSILVKLAKGQESIVVSQELVEHRLQELLHRLASQQPAVTLVYCTGRFSLAASRGLVVLPSIQAAPGVPTIHALSAAMSVVGQLLS
jgi:hypothetical protein